MSRWHDWDEPASLAAVALDDMLVDALAAGDAADETDPAFVLLAGLRADVAADPETQPAAGVSLVPLHPAWRHRARRLSRGAVAASAAFVTVLSAGGVAAASVNAGPDSVLYPVRKVLVGPAESPLDPVYRLLNSARQALDDGDPAGARRQVDAARQKLQAIGQDASKARTDLTTLEQAVATAQQPVAPPSPSQQQVTTALTTQPPSSSSGATGSASQGDTQGGTPGTAATVDPGSHVDNDATAVPSPEPTTTSAPAPSGTPSPSPSSSPSTAPSPTGGTSPSPTPASTPSGAQQPRAEGSPSPAPSTTP